MSTETWYVTINGRAFPVPDGELRDPHPDRAGGDCQWHDRSTGAACTAPTPHDDDGILHIAHDGDGNVMAMWDDAHGYRDGDGNPELPGPRFCVEVTDTGTGDTALVYVPAEDFRDAALTAAETPEGTWAEYPPSPPVPARTVHGTGEQP